MRFFGAGQGIAWPPSDRCPPETIEEIERKGAELREEELAAIRSLKSRPDMSLQRFTASATAISSEFAHIRYEAFSEILKKDEASLGAKRARAAVEDEEVIVMDSRSPTARSPPRGSPRTGRPQKWN